MAKNAERFRLKLLVDDGVNMNLGWALRFDGDRLLIDAGTIFDAGAALTLYPLSDDYEGLILDFTATVVDWCEDIMVPAHAEHRFLVTLDVQADDTLRALITEAIDSRVRPKSRTRRRDPHTHDQETLEIAFGLAG